MTIYKLAIFLCIFLVACKNDAPVNTSPPVVEPVKTKELEKPEKVNSPTPAKTVDNTNAQIKTVTVSTVEEIVQNAKSNTIMYLEKGTYELEEDLVYFMTKDERTIIDKKVVETRSIGGQLFFSGLDNFQLIGKKGAKIVSKNPKAVPFFVIQGKNWKISNLTIKKDVEGLADLAYISNCQNVEIEKCKFEGKGTYGMYVNNVENMKVKSCKISNCSTGAVRINNTRGLTFMNSIFSNNICKVPLVNFYTDKSDVTFSNVTISDNKKDPSSTFENSDRIFAVGPNTIRLENCIIQNNTGYKYLGVSQGSIGKSRIDGVSIP